MIQKVGITMDEAIAIEETTRSQCTCDAWYKESN